MKLSEIKNILSSLQEVNFVLPKGLFIPKHFHVTEVGAVQKYFIDCGGTVRKENVINFQLWEAGDFDHRLAPKKLLKIIALSEKTLDLKDQEIEVEYQAETIGKYGLDFDGVNFLLTNKQTACLASDACGIPLEKQKVALTDLDKKDANACSTTGGACC